MTSEKILVTGAAGFIGSHLVDELLIQGYKVRCFVRKTDNLQFLQKDKVEIVFGDIKNKESLKPAFYGIDIVYHLAAKVDFEGSWDEYYKTNVLGTKNVVDLAVKNKVKRLIFFSTIRVVGLKDSKRPVEESSVYNPINFYDKSKYEGEKIIFEAFEKDHLPITIIRPTSVYGPRDKGTYYSFFKTIANNRFFLVGKGSNLVSFVFVKNIVQGAILALKSKKAIGQVYFINDKEPYKMKYLSSVIAESFNRNLPKIYLPKNLGYLLGYFFLFLSKIIKIKPILTPERIKNLTISYVFSINKAKADLNYQPKYNLKEAVSETAKWYKEHGWI